MVLHDTRDDGEHNATRHNARQLTCRIGTHGMHQKEVIVIILLTKALDDACRHGEGADASRADQGVELLA